MALEQGLIHRILDFDARNFLLDSLPKNAVGMEIGVHKGDFTQRILKRTQPGLLYIVDPWKYELSDTYKNSWYGGWLGGSQERMDRRCAAVARRFAEQIASGQVKVVRAYSSAAFASLPDAHLDWVYIDGNHLYEFVKSDLEMAFRCVKSGGLITGDDYMEGGWWEGGVKRAVDEFVASCKEVELVCIKKCQYILKKR